MLRRGEGVLGRASRKQVKSQDEQLPEDSTGSLDAMEAPAKEVAEASSAAAKMGLKRLMAAAGKHSAAVDNGVAFSFSLGGGGVFMAAFEREEDDLFLVAGKQGRRGEFGSCFLFKKKKRKWLIYLFYNGSWAFISNSKMGFIFSPPICSTLCNQNSFYFNYRV